VKGEEEEDKKDRGPLPSSRISARFLNYAAAHISRLTQFIGTDSPPLLTVNKRVSWMRSSTTWRIMLKSPDEKRIYNQTMGSRFDAPCAQIVIR
jgi:hypothetical protein